jgi:hypothetical protein
MRKIVFKIVVFLMFFEANSQINYGLKADSLTLRLSRSFYLKGKSNLNYRDLYPKLEYDFLYQYPYYKIARNRIGRNNNFEISLKHLPKNGFVYVFSKDKFNSFQLLKEFSCENVLGERLGNIVLKPKILNIEYINVWYSNYKLDDIEEIFKEIKYTNGTFLKRTIYFLDEKIESPNTSWYFLNNNVSLYLNDNIKKEKFIIPIVIKLF